MNLDSSVSFFLSFQTLDGFSFRLVCLDLPITFAIWRTMFSVPFIEFKHRCAMVKVILNCTSCEISTTKRSLKWHFSKHHPQTTCIKTPMKCLLHMRSPGPHSRPSRSKPLCRNAHFYYVPQLILSHAENWKYLPKKWLPFLTFKIQVL